MLHIRIHIHGICDDVVDIVRCFPPGHTDAREEGPYKSSYTVVHAEILRDAVVACVVPDECDLLKINPQNNRPKNCMAVVDRQREQGKDPRGLQVVVRVPSFEQPLLLQLCPKCPICDGRWIRRGASVSYAISWHVLVDDPMRMKLIYQIGCVCTGQIQNHFVTPRVLMSEACDIVHLVLMYQPAIAFGTMLCNLLDGVERQLLWRRYSGLTHDVCSVLSRAIRGTDERLRCGYSCPIR
mmetsp:Transcript_5060/g.10357  ORF Transcript_5060/g.10357 Transcript_5060/m.10357 type:complete len:239 (+) Transcript_5060:1048-1764(+)